MWSLVLRILLFDFIICFAIAKLEINIEGRYGWANHLPTAKYQNWLTRLIWGAQPFTGYHLWLMLTALIFIHLPFFAFPQFWSLPIEAFTLSSFLFSVVLEDFLWFILNPFFGIRKLNRENVSWFDKWLWSIPYFYIRLISGAIILFTIFLKFNTQIF